MQYEKPPVIPDRKRFPLQGMPAGDVVRTLRDLQSGDVPIHSPRNFGAVYYASDELLGLIDEVGTAVATQNVLYAGSHYPSLRRIEQDLIGMGLDLLKAPAGAGGLVTTGGSESNFMAVKTARDAFAAKRAMDGSFEIVLAHTAHPSLEKAAEWLGLRARRVLHSDSFHADVAAMEALVTPHTIMMVGSAPPAAYAQVDPIRELAGLAARHELWFHVDSCMGGFFLPFAKQLGAAIPDFDFDVPGVWSMSADLHKFGYAPKGVSLLLFRDGGMAEYAGYRFSDWPFGDYATTGFAGSRPAAPMVSAWSAIHHLGRSGYLRITERLLGLKARLVAGIARIEGLRVLGRPDAVHVFVMGEGIDIFAVHDEMTARGYALSRAWQPDAIQVWVNVTHEDTLDEFLSELERVTRLVRNEERLTVDRRATYAT